MFTRHIDRVCAALLLLVSVNAMAWADDWEDAGAAYWSGDYNTAFRLTKNLAEQGFVESYGLLGELYHDGKGVPQDYTEAIKWYRLSAELGDSEDQFRLGHIYQYGRDGISRDYEEALKWYLLSAEQGHLGSQRQLGVMYEMGYGVPQNYHQAEKWFRLAGEQGDELSQLTLGHMYESGWYVPQDYAEAMRWYQKANAAPSLGRMYYEGLGVPQDFKEAAKWWRLAAEETNDEYSQNKLGAMYLGGNGVMQDLVQAHMWFNLAAAQGWEVAATNRAIAASKMTPAQIEEAQRLAREWLEAHPQ